MKPSKKKMIRATKIAQSTTLPATYKPFLEDIKKRIRSAQLKAATQSFYRAYAKVPQLVGQLETLPIFRIPS